eukprot:6205770-Pleurochrysis_carterae.AAC.1
MEVSSWWRYPADGGIQLMEVQSFQRSVAGGSDGKAGCACRRDGQARPCRTTKRVPKRTDIRIQTHKLGSTNRGGGVGDHESEGEHRDANRVFSNDTGRGLGSDASGGCGQHGVGGSLESVLAGSVYCDCCTAFERVFVVVYCDSCAAFKRIFVVVQLLPTDRTQDRVCIHEANLRRPKAKQLVCCTDFARQERAEDRANRQQMRTTATARARQCAAHKPRARVVCVYVHGPKTLATPRAVPRLCVGKSSVG